MHQFKITRQQAHFLICSFTPRTMLLCNVAGVTADRLTETDVDWSSPTAVQVKAQGHRFKNNRYSDHVDSV